MKRSFFYLIPQIVSTLFLVLFVYTAVSKILDYRNFYSTMEQMPALKGLVSVLAPSIIIAELIIAAILVVPARRIQGLYLSLTLMTAFTFYLLFAVMSGYELPCSCGGVLRQLSWKQHVIFNFGFILFAMSGIMIDHKQKIFIAISGGLAEASASPGGKPKTP
jgi:hypothetical protein